MANPFVWADAIEDGVPRAEFAQRVAAMLKAGTHVTLFGSRGIGKTTFLGELGKELAREPEADALPYELVNVDLRSAISLRAFSSAVRTALSTHPSQRLRRKAQMLLSNAEAHLSVNLGVVKAGVRHTGGGSQADDAELLFAHLRAAGELADRVVVAFDEFQRLASCPGEPLSIIRSALMGPGRAGRVGLLFTGSLRERLALMLHTSTEPIWDQTFDLELPALDRIALMEYLELRFQATDRPIDEYATEYLVGLTDCHPKRTQQLAWHTWELATSNSVIAREDVHAAFEALLDPEGLVATELQRLLDTLLNGTDSDVNNARALLLLSAGESLGSQYSANRYGLSDPHGTRRALERLKDRGIVEHRNSQWEIVDPLLVAWLKRQNPYG